MSEIKYTGLGTHLKVADLDASRHFYEDILQFKKVFEYGPQFPEFVAGSHAPERYRGMTFDTGSGLLEIAEGHLAVKKEVHQECLNSSKVSAMVKVETLVPVIEQCNKYGVDLAVEPRHFYWATVEMVLVDPDGYRLVYIATATDEECARVQELTTADLERKTPDYWA